MANERTHENSNDNGRFKVNIFAVATIISLLAMGAGLVANYTLNTARIEILERSYKEIQLDFKDYQKSTDKVIIDMRFNLVTSNKDIKEIKDDIGEIKGDIKKLLNSN